MVITKQKVPRLERYVPNARVDEDDTVNPDSLDQSRKKDLKHLVKDTKIILLFLCLYAIQVIPIGLSNAIPLIMSSKKASMKDQGIYSFASWPYTIRLLYVSEPVLLTGSRVVFVKFPLNLVSVRSSIRSL